MDLNAHHREPVTLMEPVHLLRVVGLRAAHAVEGRYWRASHGVDPLDTSLSRQEGGRFNPPWEFEALYCSWSRELSLKELAARAETRPPRVTPLDVRLDRVLDLSDPFLRTSLLLREADLTGEDEDLTRRLGRAARDVGFEGLLVPAVFGGRDLVVFLDRLGSRSYVHAFEERARLIA